MSALAPSTAIRAPRWEVISAADLDLDNGPDERWYVVCRHAHLIGFRTKADALAYRAQLWDWRRTDRAALAEICDDCPGDR